MMKLDVTRFSLAEQVNQGWTVTVESGTTLQDVLQPEFFANVSSRLRPYDRMYVRIDTGEWYAELLVLSCGRVWAKLIPVFTLDLTTQDVEVSQADAADRYLIQYRGPHLKFCVIRRVDKAPIKEQLENKAEAQAWLSSYLLTT